MDAPRVQVKTAKVVGRRSLRFNEAAEMLADAERLAAAKSVTALGNWTLGQVLDHLARSMNMAIDGARFTAPWYIRMSAPLFKKRMLAQPLPAGFQLPRDAARQLIPLATVSTEQGIAKFRRAVERQNLTTLRAKSPVFGRMTREEWDRLYLRHAELHLSFFVPE